jgi:predicted RNA-binding protein YlqC (UPF0109 family)
MLHFAVTPESMAGMAAEPHAEVCALLSLLLRAMVDKPEEVAVRVAGNEGVIVVLQVECEEKDRGKLIGKQGRTARSLRIILASIAKTQGTQYRLDIDGGD